jgi:hypothetical protein
VTGIEQPLAGGRLSSVVRVGDTVRRPVGHWTEAVHALLRHLEARGFAAAPRVLGVDRRDREILSYLPGDAIAGRSPWPAWARTQDTLRSAAHWLQGYHAAVAEFIQPAGTRWRLVDARVQPGQVVCHNDWAPYNAVRLASGGFAAIDWDTASPGHPHDDVAFAVWNFVPLWGDAHCRELGWRAPVDRPRRVAEFLDVYGLQVRRGFVERIGARMQKSIDRIEAGARAGDPAFTRLIESGRLDSVRAARERLDRDATLLERALA